MRQLIDDLSLIIAGAALVRIGLILVDAAPRLVP